MAAGIFPRELGKMIGRLQQLREKSDYDDFYIASKEQAEQQLHTAEQTIKQVTAYLEMKETGDE